MPYNVISCKGWETASGWIASSPCLKSRIGLVILFFIIAIVRKWGGEEIGVDFSFLFSLLFGLGSYLILITLFGNFKIALVVGIIISLIVGYGVGIFFSSGEDYY